MTHEAGRAKDKPSSQRHRPICSGFGSMAIKDFSFSKNQVNQFKYCSSLQIFVEICTSLEKMQTKAHL
jgi:hypothetical protein